MAIIALNLYSLRQHCQNPVDLDRTFARLAEIGYPAVQVSGVGDVAVEDIRRLLDKHDLRCVACHEGIDQLRNDFPGILRKLRLLEADFTALGHPKDELAPGNFDAFVAELEVYAERFAEQGVRFGYHNHALEFERRNGATLLERIYAETKLLRGEPDVHWIQRGGGDPVSWIRKLAGRLPAVHLKDYVWKNGDSRFAEVGHGNLDWTGILGACAEAGVEYYIVEQDTPSDERDIFDSVALSYIFLKERVL